MKDDIVLVATLLIHTDEGKWMKAEIVLTCNTHTERERMSEGKGKIKAGQNVQINESSIHWTETGSFDHNRP